MTEEIKKAMHEMILRQGGYIEPLEQMYERVYQAFTMKMLTEEEAGVLAFRILEELNDLYHIRNGGCYE